MRIDEHAVGLSGLFDSFRRVLRIFHHKLFHPFFRYVVFVSVDLHIYLSRKIARSSTRLYIKLCLVLYCIVLYCIDHAILSTKVCTMFRLGICDFHCDMDGQVGVLCIAANVLIVE